MSGVDRIDHEPVAQVRWFAVVSLVGHLGLVGLGAWSLWVISGGWWLGAVTAPVFVLLYAAMWRFWLAPGSRRRLGYRERFTATIVVVPLVVVLAALGEVWLPAVVAGSFVLLGDALNRHN
ncbi:MAG: hypothetical protein GX596_00495 [Propionibacterium sp.]|nr:hypothetical protein [Propionibacterium sp.]